MLNALKRQKEFKVISPADGVAVELKDVPDDAFSEGLLGKGVAVILKNGEIFSPVDGEILDITDTRHAFCITTDDGTQILLHIGIDTVKLKGEGFSVKISSGEKVKAGTKIADVDLEILKKHSIPSHTPVILTEPNEYEITKTFLGEVRGGQDALYLYKRI